MFVVAVAVDVTVSFEADVGVSVEGAVVSVDLGSEDALAVPALRAPVVDSCSSCFSTCKI
jgi:hypothetical protein